MKKAKRRSSNRKLRTNELSVLEALRRGGSVSKPDLARHIEISPQAMNLIVDGLVRDGLVRKGGERGGRVGHPSSLFTLSPSGAYSIGIKLAESGLDVVLSDFVGATIYRARIDHSPPEGATLAKLINQAIDLVYNHAQSNAVRVERICGLGLALPNPLSKPFSPEYKLISDALLRNAAADNLRVILSDHGTTATFAELSKRSSDSPSSFLYLSIGPTIENGLVIDSVIRHGPQGPHLLGDVRLEDGRALQDKISTRSLLAALAAEGFKGGGPNELYAAMNSHSAVVHAWSRTASRAILSALLPLHAAIGLEAIVIEADLPSSLLDAIIGGIRENELDLGCSIRLPRIERAIVGRDAALLGAAILPLQSAFSPVSARCGARGKLGSVNSECFGIA